MTPLIRGSNPRLPEPLAGRCPPDTRAFAQPSAPRAAGPVADGPLPLPNRDVQLYGLTGRLPLLTPFSRPSSRAPATLHACCDFASAMPAPAGPHQFGPEYATGRWTQTAAPFGSTSGGHARGFAPPPFADRRSRRFVSAVGRVEPQGPSRTPLPRDRDDLPVTQTCT